MNITKLIATLSLAVTLTTTMTSNPLSIHASPTTEDDGWVEGDYEGSPEEQEDWEDANMTNNTDDGHGYGYDECQQGELIDLLDRIWCDLG